MTRIADTHICDVAVLGAGPAGAAAAGLLASWGYRVLVAERAPTGGAPSHSLAESLPPSTKKALAATGLLDATEGAGFHPNQGNTARWHGETRSDDFAGGARGYHVLRSDFDKLLRREAAKRGARFLDGVARRCGLDGSATDYRTEIDLTVESRSGRSRSRKRTQIRAGWVLDCTGRAGLTARRHRVKEDAPTLALVRRFERSDGWTEANVPPSHAVVESAEWGWGWSVPVSSSERQVGVMLDPDLSVRSQRAANVATTFDACVAGTQLLRSIADSARPLGDAWAVAASMYRSADPVSGRVLCVGDAASFADPMSSFGVKKALASAWLAAIVVNTAVRNPSMESAALDFFRLREREMYVALRHGLAAQVWASADTEDRFWTKRTRWLSDRADPADANAPAGPDADTLRSDPGLGAALRELRASSGRLQQRELVTMDKPLVTGREIRMAPALVTPRFRNGVRHFLGADLLRIALLAPASANPGALFESYIAWASEEAMPPVGLADFLGIVALLVADGVLEIAPAVG